jgi:hypothetical protein
MAKRSTGIVARVAALEKLVAGMFSRTATAKKAKRRKTKIKKAKRAKTNARATSAKATAKRKSKAVGKRMLVLPIEQPLMGESLLAIPTGQL